MKILIAEDDAFFRRLLYQLLLSEYEVMIVADGDSAWETLQATKGPLLAILDWVMPGLAGPEICRAVRANAKTAGTYVILLTARDSSADILAGFRSGADDYVTKPFKPDELRARVRLGQRVLRLEQAVTTQKAALESGRRREAFLQNRLAALESVQQEAALLKTAAADAMYAGTLDVLNINTELSSNKPAITIPPVNDGKVS